MLFQGFITWQLCIFFTSSVVSYSISGVGFDLSHKAVATEKHQFKNRPRLIN